jgi:hypothetical protein
MRISRYSSEKRRIAHIIYQDATLSTSPVAVANSRNRAGRNDLEKGWRLAKWINFDILVWNAFDL